MTSYRYENLIKTAIWWAVVGGQELPLCNGHGHPEVLSADGEIIKIPSGTAIYERNKIYMLKLTQQQLEFLAFVDSQDDWHPAGFLDVIREFYENSKEKPFDKTEFENMMEELKKLTTGKIANLQIALCAFGNI